MGATTPREQQPNDWAWFVLAWDRLGTEVDDACGDVIRQGQPHDDWRYRRAWSLSHPDDRQLSGLSFKNHLTLVLEKESEEGDHQCQNGG